MTSVTRPPSTRQLKAAEQIKRSLANGFIRGGFHFVEFSAPVTVSEVRITPDLKNATIYVAPLAGKIDRVVFMKAIEKVVPELRKIVAREVNLKFCPELHFKYDDLIERSARLDDLFKKIHQ